MLFFLWFDQCYDSYLEKQPYGYFKLLHSFFSTQLLFSRLYHINFNCHSNNITLFNIWIWISLIDNYCKFILAKSIAPLPRLSNVNWLNSHNKHCNSMMIGNYSTLLIGDSIIAGSSCNSNIWKTYFKLLYAINCGIGGDRVENILWQCKNLQSCPNLQNVVIKWGKNNIQHNSVEDIVDGIVLSLRRIYHQIAIFVCSLFPGDSNWSINRVYIDEINNYLCCKSRLNGINFINHTDWTFQDVSLKPNLFYADKLRLTKEGNARLAASIYNSINPNASNINEILSVSSKVFACDTDFNLKQEDFPMLPCNVFVRNCMCHPDKPTIKCEC